MDRPRFLCRSLAALAVALPFVLGHAPAATTAQTTSAGGHDVIANLWEWNWHSVAQECVNVLGPDGYGGVQVAPPQDSYASDAHQWYDVYQPVDYNLTSRMGNEEQFKDMVTACRGAGVKVYVDAVINHMANDGSVSYGGVHYTKYNYPDYAPADFHHYPADCPEPDGSIHDFNDYTQVTKCELLGLPDLRTESTHVRDTLAAYLNKLIGYGVSGFRVDAAKHIGQTDLAAIESRLHTTADGTAPYLALEVASGSSGQLAPKAFESVGSVLDFDYATGLHDQFHGSIISLRGYKGGVSNAKALVFVENHDTERDGSTLSYKDGATNILATEFMLAYPFGRPQVYASFSFSYSDQPPPSDAHGFVTDTDCSHGWVCNDRNPGIAHMVQWHNDVAGTKVGGWYDDGSNLIAFRRGHKGWIAINNEGKARKKTFSTGLKKGTYCDIIHGTNTAGACSGPKVKVDAHGRAKIKVPAHSAVALDAKDLVRKH